MSRLDSLLVGIEKQGSSKAPHANSLSSSSTPDGQPRTQLVAEGLYQARKNALSIDIPPERRENEVEIECRIGLALHSGEMRRLFPMVPGRGDRGLNLQRAPSSFRPGTSQLSFRNMERLVQTSRQLIGAKISFLDETVYIEQDKPRVVVGRASDGEVEMHSKLSDRSAALERLAQEVVTLSAQTGKNAEETQAIASTAGALSSLLHGQAPSGETVSRDVQVRCESKEKLCAHLDIALVSCAHDLRISGVRETPQEVRPDFEATATSTRLKKRKSILLENHPDLGAWQLDLTTAVTTPRGTNQESVTSYEAELEMTRSARRLLLRCPEEEAIAVSMELARQLFNWLDMINHPSDAHDNLSLVPLTKNDPIRTNAQELCRSLLIGREGVNSLHGLDFPGSMPVNMCKRHLPQITSRDYYVTEKTDGVRQLLAVVERGGTPTAVFVDRGVERDSQGRNWGLQARSCPNIKSMLPSGSVLDGELVFNFKLRKHVFMVFDILQFGQENLMSLCWADRVAKLPLETFKSTHAPGYEGLVIVAKVFWPKGKIDSLLKSIGVDGGDHVYRAKAKKAGDVELWHKTDGVIFQPNSPYECGTDHKLFKWKFTDCITVDLAVQIFDGDAVFTCGDNTDLRGIATLGFEDTARLCADLSNLKTQHATICEVGLDPGTGEWFYKGIRPDKDRPNALKTVLSTLVELAENVSVEELEWRLLDSVASSSSSSSSSGGDWAAELQGAETNLLEEMRLRVSSMKSSKKRKPN